MQLSESTLTVLKNFSTINPSILFKAGNVISTVTPLDTVLARATVKDNFSKDFAIYDLGKFISVLSLFKEPNIEIGDKQLVIKSGKQKAKYTLAEPSMIKKSPYKSIPVSNVIATLEMKEDFNTILKASSVMQLPDCFIKSEDGVLYCMLSDSANPTSDVFELDSEGKAEDEEGFEIKFKVDNLKVVGGIDYTISVPSSKNFIYLEGKNSEISLEYWIACEQAKR